MVSYKSDREKGPVYSMGSADPRTIARGKRLISGVCVFVVFDRDTLVESIGANNQVYLNKDETANFARGGYASADARAAAAGGGSIGTMSGTQVSLDGNGNVTSSGLRDKIKSSSKPYLSDQLLPFDITLVGANEYGQVSKMIIHGVELMTEAGGVSIDDLVLEKQMSFLAKRITPWERVA
jgi:hypothetical protein